MNSMEDSPSNILSYISYIQTHTHMYDYAYKYIAKSVYTKAHITYY